MRSLAVSFHGALAVAALLVLTPALAERPLSESDFARAYATVLEEKQPDIEVVTEGPLALYVRTKDGEQNIVLHNAYELYVNDPDSLDDIVNRYADSALESLASQNLLLTTENIMPVVKDSAWLGEVQAAMRARGSDDDIDYYFEPLADGLVVFYVIDSPRNIQYVSREIIEASGIGFENLRDAAVQNLVSLLNRLVGESGDGIFALYLDGNYDASLLLVDAVWNGSRYGVRGDIVVAVPSREGVFISGTKEQAGLELLADYTDEVYSESPYRLTRNFYRRLGNAWFLWKTR